MTDTLRVLAEKPADDLVKRLLDRGKVCDRNDGSTVSDVLLLEAAAALTEANARVARLEGALKANRVVTKALMKDI